MGTDFAQVKWQRASDVPKAFELSNAFGRPPRRTQKVEAMLERSTPLGFGSSWNSEAAGENAPSGWALVPEHRGPGPTAIANRVYLDVVWVSCCSRLRPRSNNLLARRLLFCLAGSGRLRQVGR